MLKLCLDFINPGFFNQIKTGEKLKGIVVKNDLYVSYANPEGYMIEVVGDSGNCVQKCSIKETTTEIFEGMEIQVRLVNGFARGFTKEECEQEKIEREKKLEEYRKKKEAEEQKELEDSISRKEDCKKFYKNLSIGVKVTPIYRVVMSGLTENSMGNGVYKNTVTHLRVEEDLTDGKRFNRSAGEILCKSKRNGKKSLWDEESISVCLDGEEYKNKVTCKSCLKILKNKGWIKE